jgi:hypothetical protein
MLADMARERANPPQSCTNRRANFFIEYANRMTTSDGANPQPQLLEQMTSGYIPGHFLRVRKNFYLTRIAPLDKESRRREILYPLGAIMW